MKTVKLSKYGPVITQKAIDAINVEMSNVTKAGEPITLDFAEVKGIDSDAAHKLVVSIDQGKAASVQMKNASPMVKSVMMYSSGATGSVKAGVSASAGRGRKPRFSFFRKFVSLLCALTLGVGQMWGTVGSTYATSFEGDTEYWKKNGGTAGINTVEHRTGSKAAWHIPGQANSSKRCDLYDFPISYTKNNSEYMHLIFYAKTRATISELKYSIYLGSEQGSVTKTSGLPSSSSWTRYTTYGSKTTSYTSARAYFYIKLSSASDTVYYDDIITYVSQSTTTDLTAPSAATSASATTSSISWKNGSDSGTGATGRQYTLIWKRNSGNMHDLSLNNQGVYAVNASDQSGNWTCISATVAAGTDNATSSYSGTLTAGAEYAIVHRDLAYNYSSPTYVTVAAACTDPTASWSTAPASGTVGGSMNASLTTNYAAGVVYSSSNTDVATVSGNGSTTCTISYVAAGSARITATVTGDGTTICTGPATCYTDITVTAPCTAPTSFTLTPTYANSCYGFEINITDAARTTTAEQNYEYYYSTTNSAPGANPASNLRTITGSKTHSTNTDVGLAQGTLWYFWVRAVCDASNKSSWIGPVSATSLYQVHATANTAGYGSVSPEYIQGVSSGTSVSTSSNILTVGASSITATPTEQTAQYTYAFSNWTKTNGDALPSTVTSNLQIHANFTQTPRSYTVTHTLTNVTSSSGTTATYGTNYTATFAASSGYTLPSTISVSRGGTPLTVGTHYSWNQGTGALTINGDQNTGAITVTITGDEITSYTVTYNGSNAASGNVPVDNNSPYTSGSTVTVLGNSGNLTKAFEPEPSELVPATFIGWNTNSNTYGGTHYDEDDQFTISGNTTLYAVWGYPIAYDADGGTINDASYPSYYICTYPDDDATTTLPSNVTKDGYTFDGWYTNNGSGSKVTAISGAYTGAFTGDYALKAKWTCTSPTFGTDLSTSQVDYSVGAEASALTVAATAGSGTVTYQWYSNDENNYTTPTTLTNCTTATYTPSTAAEGTTYYFCVATNTSAGNCTTNSNIAKIVVSTVSYTLTYALGGATGAQSGGSAADSYAEGATITVPAVGSLTKSGYTFRGWHDGTTFYLAGQTFSMPASNVTLTAVWEGASGGSYTYTFESSKPGNPLGTYFDITTSAGSGHTYEIASSLNSNNIKASDLVGGGSYFLGGTISTSNVSATYKTNASYTNIDSIAFYENASDNGKPTYVFKVVDASSGTALYTSSTLDHKTIKGSNGTNTWTGRYRLDLHSAPKTGKIQIDVTSGSSGKYYALDNITVYYKGNDTIFDVSFADGNTAPASHLTWPDDIVGVPTGKKILAPSTTPTAAGYTFGGWYSNAACTAGNEINWNTMTITTNKTIYAKWTANTYNINYYDQGGEAFSGEHSATPPTTHTYGTATTLKSASKSCYTFGGWYTNSSCTGTAVASLAATGYTADINLYAKWTLDLDVTTEPTTPVAATVGEASSISMAATGASGYQWQTCNSDGSGAVDITSGSQYANYTTNTLSFTPASTGTYCFRCKITDACSHTDYTNVVTVNAKIAPTIYSLSADVTSLCNATATITLSGSQSGINYQLYKDNVASGDPKAGTGYALSWTGIDATGSYTVKTVETSTYAEATMYGSVTISIMTPTSISTQPTNLGAMTGISATLGSGLVATGEGTLYYQWYSCDSEGNLGEAVTEPSTTKTYTVTKNVASTTWFYYKVKVTGDCGEVYSNVVGLQVRYEFYLRYNANGGTGAPSGVNKAPGLTTLYSTPIPTRDGYVFLGWNTKDDGLGDMYQPGGNFVMPAAATTLYATWASPCFSFTCSSQSSSVSDIASGSAITPSSWESGKATLTGGTMTNSSAGALGVNKTRGLVMVKSTKEVTVTLTSGQFQAGTVISLEGTTNNENSKSYGFALGSVKLSGTKSTESTGAYTAFSQRYVVVADDGIEGTNSVVVKMNGDCTGSQVYLSAIYIGGCMSCTTITPSLSYDNTTLYAFGGTPRGAVPTLTGNTGSGAVSYSSSNTDVVTVDSETGVVTAVGAGTATITASIASAGDYCGANATCNITVPALVTQTLNVASSTAWGTTPALTFSPSDKGMEQVLRLTKNTFTFDSTSTSTKQDGTSKRWMTASFTGSETTKGKYLKMAFKNTQHNLRLGEVVVPIQPISSNGSAQVEIYEGSTLRMTSTAVTGITAGSLADVHFTFASPYVFAAGSTINVYIYFYGQTNGFRMASPVLVNGAVLTDYEYTGAGADANWSTTANWNWGKLPMIGDDVIVKKPVIVDITNARAKSIVLDQSGDNTGTLEVLATGALVVKESIQKKNASGELVGTSASDLILSTNSSSNGALIMKGYTGGNNATIGFYTKAHKDATYGWINQFIGQPFTGADNFSNFYGSYLYKFDAATPGWVNQKSGSTSDAFAGYNVLRKDAAPTTLVMNGELVSCANHTCNLYYNGSTDTENMIGNSWTAPIDIAAMAGAFTNCNATIYIFNSGSMSQQDSHSTSDGSEGNNSPGQYIVLPVGSAPWTSPAVKVIPSMQAFSVYATGSSPSVTLNYETMVYNPAVASTTNINTATRVQRRERMDTDKPDIMKLFVTGESGSSDIVYMLMRDDWTTGFENGYDGRKMYGLESNPQLYAVSAAGEMTVNCVAEAEGTVIGLKPGADNTYTFTFSYDGDQTLYLNDLKTQQSVLISNESSYTFFTEEGDTAERFIISATPFGAPEVATGTVSGERLEVSGARKVIYNEKMYILYNGRVFDGTGKIVK